jgi:hypothetical protein
MKGIILLRFFVNACLRGFRILLGQGPTAAAGYRFNRSNHPTAAKPASN